MAAKIQIIIPAWNEQPRIGAVLEVVCSYSAPKKILVIDDGSSDGTRSEAEKFPVEVFVHEKNLGKGAALQSGLDRAGPSPYWLFLDADLIGLSHDHIDQLLEPLYRSPTVGMTVGLLLGKKLLVNAAQRWFSMLNGQRALAGYYAESLPDLRWSRFGVEIVLSKYARSQKIGVEEPVLEGLTHYTKEEKFGLTRGLGERLKMYGECIHSLRCWKQHIHHFQTEKPQL